MQIPEIKNAMDKFEIIYKAGYDQGYKDGYERGEAVGYHTKDMESKQIAPPEWEGIR